MKCQACHSNEVGIVQKFKPYIDFEVEVFDCTSCGARFVERDDSIYEQLHNSSQTYLSHDAYARTIFQAFKEGVLKLRTKLSTIDKNKFVIDSIDQIKKKPMNILEIGCSCGYLSSYFIAQGHSVLGVDLSPTAIEKAIYYFGDHFVLSGDEKIKERGPYDVIYHVGTIGCVDDPIGFTNKLLSQLKSGGKLLFNAPNRSSCDRFGVPWLMGTQPPDLVTLFDQHFWVDTFGNDYDVSITKGYASHYSWIAYYFYGLTGYRPKGKLFDVEVASDKTNTNFKSLLLRGIKGILGLIGRLPIFPRVYGDFSVFVEIRKK